MVDEVLLEHETPALDRVQQRVLEGPGVDEEPRVEHVCVLQGVNFFEDLLVGVDLKKIYKQILFNDGYKILLKPCSNDCGYMTNYQNHKITTVVICRFGKNHKINTVVIC